MNSLEMKSVVPSRRRWERVRGREKATEGWANQETYERAVIIGREILWNDLAIYYLKDKTIFEFDH